MTTACSPPSTLDKIRSEGVLHVITRNAPSVYYQDRGGPTGFEYELAKRFADDLEVELRVRVAEGNTEILSVLERNYAHIGLAGLTAGDRRKDNFHTLPNRLTTESVVIYNRDSTSVKQSLDLEGRVLHTLANSNHPDHLEELSRTLTNIDWHAHDDLDTAGLLERVESGEFPLAVVDANELALNQVFFPNVKRGFSLNEPEELVWLFPQQQDQSLVEAAEAFLQRVQDNGTLRQIRERFYGHLDRLNYVGAQTFVKQVNERLPTYEPLFREYGAQEGLDWKLLAAVAYQESHLRPDATSPTGVRGLMMLTQNTAKQVGISNRLNPEQSIQGGARYITRVHGKIPGRIPEPDRTWFALASYNVGFGHLEDARILTQAGGKNPDRWMDVKEFLPRLAQKKWYTKTRFGYARGHEPVVYVQNIRRYYDMLTWMQNTDKPGQQITEPGAAENDGIPETAGNDDPNLPRALDMTPPTL
ncbi:MAG: membrane-bound lytic murein transglycosylase MltF [Oleiphilaceae bacterium]|nr:membrane-bound lytic murein transglycosylase MltF [Oleiphilaceae bacterium]